MSPISEWSTAKRKMFQRFAQERLIQRGAQLGWEGFMGDFSEVLRVSLTAEEHHCFHEFNQVGLLTLVPRNDCGRHALSVRGIGFLTAVKDWNEYDVVNSS